MKLKKLFEYLKYFWLLHVLVLLWVAGSAVQIICAESVVIKLLAIILIFLAGALEGILFDLFDDE